MQPVDLFYGCGGGGTELGRSHKTPKSKEMVLLVEVRRFLCYSQLCNFFHVQLSVSPVGPHPECSAGGVRQALRARF